VEKNVCHAPEENGKGNVFDVRHETKRTTKTLYCAFYFRRTAKSLCYAFFLDAWQREVFNMSLIKSIRQIL
jgi:hypothetical protein